MTAKPQRVPSLLQRITVVMLISGLLINLIVFFGVGEIHKSTNTRRDVVIRIFQSHMQIVADDLLKTDHSAGAIQTVLAKEPVEFVAFNGTEWMTSGTGADWLKKILESGDDFEHITDHGERTPRDRMHIVHVSNQGWNFLFAPFGNTSPSAFSWKEVALILIGTMLVSLVNYIVTRSLLAPLAVLRQGVETVSSGDLSVRIEISPRHELSRLSNAFNKMCEEITSLINEKERMLADVSHDLRTPLARIRVAADLLDSPKYSAAIIKDVEILDHLIKSILTRAKFSQAAVLVSMPVRELVETLAATMKLEFPDLAWSTGLINGELTVEADQEALAMAIRNTVDNAYKFTPADRPHPKLTVEIRDSQVLIFCIHDFGSGIKSEHLSRVREAFFRSDAARDPNQRGYGLGLNICERIITNHRGSMTIESKVDEGTIVQFSLPLC